jgi:hypothetical protein
MAFDIPGLTFLKAHENLLIAVVLAVVLFSGVSKVLDYKTNHDQKKLDALTAQLQSAIKDADAAKQEVAAGKAEASLDKATNAQLIAALTAQNAALNAAMAARDKATQGQVNVDLHANIPYLGKRFMSLVPGIDGKDIAVSNDAKHVTIGQDTAQKTVAQLELVPTLQADLKDSKQETKNVQTELKSQQNYTAVLEKLSATQDKMIGMQEKEIALADKTCDARVKVADDKGNKKLTKGLKWGVILGFIGGALSHGLVH